jgi:hypothetical protein
VKRKETMHLRTAEPGAGAKTRLRESRAGSYREGPADFYAAVELASLRLSASR